MRMAYHESIEYPIKQLPCQIRRLPSNGSIESDPAIQLVSLRKESRVSFTIESWRFRWFTVLCAFCKIRAILG